MEVGSVSQQSEVVELALDEIEIVSGGFPIVPPSQSSNGGGG